MHKSDVRIKLSTIALGLAIVIAATSGSAQAGKPLSTITGSVLNGGKRVTLVIPHGGHATPINRKTGLFAVSGHNLTGPHTLKFLSGGKKYLTNVNVPLGGKLTLKGVKLISAIKIPSNPSSSSSASSGTAKADEEDLTVFGTLTSVDCSVSPSTITVTTASADVFNMTFDPATTEIVNQQTGQVITDCMTLQALAGQPVEVEMRVNPTDGSLFANQVNVNPNSNDQTDSEFDGVIASMNCPGSISVTGVNGVSVVVNLSSSTEIEIDGASDESSGTCTDFNAGMSVKVEGALRQDGSVDADSITVQTAKFEASGTINSTTCGTPPESISFTPNGSTTALTVTIGAGTEIQVSGNDSAACSDLLMGAADVEGVTQADGSVAATNIGQGD